MRGADVSDVKEVKLETLIKEHWQMEWLTTKTRYVRTAIKELERELVWMANRADEEAVDCKFHVNGLLCTIRRLDDGNLVTQVYVSQVTEHAVEKVELGVDNE